MRNPRLRTRLVGPLVVCSIVLVGLVSAPTGPIASAARRPNVVIIVSDDQRWDKLTPSYTPQIWDRLVDTPADALHPDATSTAFANGFVPTPLCCPSRSSILTGSYAHTTGVWTNSGSYGGFHAFGDRHTIAVDFNDAGYRTAMIGKYLNGYDVDGGRYVPPGWDRWFAFGNAVYYDYQVISAHRYGSSTTESTDGRRLNFGHRPWDYSTRVLTKRAVTFVKAAQDADQPFFLYLALAAPHGPATPDPRDIDRFAGDPDVAFPSDPTSSMLEAGYGADRAVGRVLDAIDPNTIVVYLSDNGYLWGEHGLYGKAQPYNEAIRVPIVVASMDGGFTPSANADDLVLNVDLRPTLTRAAGVPMLTRAEGLNLGATTYRPRDRFVLELGGAGPFCGVREADWMYARFADGRELLFDGGVDPDENDDLMPQVGTVPAVTTRYGELRTAAEQLCDPPPPGFAW